MSKACPRDCFLAPGACSRDVPDGPPGARERSREGTRDPAAALDSSRFLSATKALPADVLDTDWITARVRVEGGGGRDINYMLAG